MCNSSEITAFDVDLQRFHIHARLAAAAMSGDGGTRQCLSGMLYCIDFSSITASIL